MQESKRCPQSGFWADKHIAYVPDRLRWRRPAHGAPSSCCPPSAERSLAARASGTRSTSSLARWASGGSSRARSRVHRESVLPPPCFEHALLLEQNSVESCDEYGTLQAGNISSARPDLGPFCAHATRTHTYTIREAMPLYHVSMGDEETLGLAHPPLHTVARLPLRRCRRSFIDYTMLFCRMLWHACAPHALGAFLLRLGIALPTAPSASKHLPHASSPGLP